MTHQEIVHPSISPFHRGEQAIQQRLGVRDKMEQFGQQVIRDYLPEQHREFYAQLPFILIGHADKNGWPWASFLFDRPGFMVSDHTRQLNINALPVPGDPLLQALKTGNRLGLLGIELETRRRNRIAGHISGLSDSGFSLDIDQAFGNCPQYIQTRTMQPTTQSSTKPTETLAINHLDQAAIDLIGNSDTLFVASFYAHQKSATNQGADVSHRGGRPGFIRVDHNRQLTIPDYLGNFHFNTLGNFIENPRAGLLFIDFTHGHMLTLTGTVEILWDAPDLHYFKGAERLWTFQIEKGIWLKNVLPFQWQLLEYSPNTQLTGSWSEAEAIKTAERLKNTWQPYQLVKIVKESETIKSFYLKAPESQKPVFKAGQFLTLKATVNEAPIIRTYTLSSAPGDELLRISVKRESGNDTQAAGVFSNFMHTQLQIGDQISAKAPTGAFSINTTNNKPAILISAGIGITPMLSMARHILQEGVRTRSIRPITLVCAARNQAQRAFFKELNTLADHSAGAIRVFWALSQPEPDLQPNEDFHLAGRISKAWLQSILPIDDYEVYICGPESFMQDQYQLFREFGIPDQQIFAEAFGPASLIRDFGEQQTDIEPTESAEQAIVTFTQSGVEQAWSKGDGNLLTFAEAHGISPEYGCRSGQCGSCIVKKLQGEVSYQQNVSVAFKQDEVVLCCAVPARDEHHEITRLEIAI